MREGRTRWPESAGGPDGSEDDGGHHAGAGDHGQVRRVDLGDVRARVLGHGQLLSGRDGTVSGANHRPGPDLPPGQAKVNER